jgi:hypothetical protein
VPVNYTLRDQGGVVHVRATGRFTLADVKTFLAALAGDPGVQPDHVTLFDTSAATFGGIDDDSFAQVLEMEKLHPKAMVSRKLAILIKDKRFLRHAGMFQSQTTAGSERVRVFTSLVEATNWLSQ